MRQYLPLAAAAIALSAGFSGSAVALTVTEHKAAPDAWTVAAGSGVSSTYVPGTWLSAPSTVAGNDPGIFRSPFDDEGVTGDTTLNDPYIGLEYFAVGPNKLAKSATMTFAVNQTSLSFLWGSVDTYNTISFFLDGNFAGAVKGGADAVGPPAITGFTGGNVPQRGASYVTISGLLFDEIRFNSETANALEWSHMKTTPVPIPAAAWLLGSGLLALIGVARRRRG